MAEAAILRVRHCGAAIFCRRAPELCPACGRPLRGAGLSAAPLRLPSPFRHGHRQPRAFLLRPTAGTFLGGYDGKSDLHVGITNSNGKKYLQLPCKLLPTSHTLYLDCVPRSDLPPLPEEIQTAWQLLQSRLHLCGVVYNYSAEGVERAEVGWEQCISIPLVQPDMFQLLQRWDELLEEFSTGEAWLPHRYEEHDHNCYTYALAFINSVLTAQGKRQMSKSEFTEKFVIPQTRKASRYITLHQALAATEFYIVTLPEPEKQCWK